QSFAGLYLCILGVQRDGLLDAFKRVLASMYSPRALSYRLTNGYELSSAGMAMCCLQMINAHAAGVCFSRHPVNLRSNDVLINGVWGLGEAVADGSAVSDEWLVSRATMRVTRETIVGKLTQVVLKKTPEGTMAPQVQEVDEMLVHVPCLTPPQIMQIAQAAIKLEHHYQYPQDIEWVLDEDEQLLLLQARPMGFDATSADERAPELKGIKPLVRSADIAAKGVACGRVMVMDPDEDMTHFPEGDVLVLTHSSPHATVAMQRACAIIAEVGSLTGHMASVCREYGVPTLINVPGVTELLKDGQLVTVDAFKGRVFDGEIPELLELRIQRPPVANTPATAFMRRLAPHVLPLHLVDPRSAAFCPQNCTSLHDIMRFIHEKSYKEMFTLSDEVSESSENVATQFVGAIPLDLYIIDLGGGLRDPMARTCCQEDVTSIPFSHVLAGMLCPEVQAKGPRPVNLHGFMSVMGHSALGPSAAERFGDHSYAIISDRYLNFSSRVGYHYAILDSWCGTTVSKNYIRFEFAGGAAGSLQRERRVRCIGLILKKLGFRVAVIGDRVQARYQKYPREQTVAALNQIGRLLIMTRQMDMLMTSEEAVVTFAGKFLNGEYH
ncbi:MAG: PEP/pyruvate-binding domain-containing protein, partial [Desulfovibrionaceae bacterium]|nr:PEP/pyruvate-binding domain-containing protein [Desulfovibrionaceae bacterium]